MSNCKVNFNKSGKVFCKNCEEINKLIINDCCELDCCCEHDCCEHDCCKEKKDCCCERDCCCKEKKDCCCEHDCCCKEKKDCCKEQKLCNPCVTAPMAEPRLLTLLSNAVFDETGINLCKTEVIIGDETNVNFDDFSCAKNLFIRVLDICTEDSTINFLECKPNCVRVRLTKLKGKFEGKLVDECGNILTVFIFYADFLSDCSKEKNCKCDCSKIDTNPEAICTDLYAPNGVTYDGECPVINFIGFDVNNNWIKQGIILQADAKALKLCIGEPLCGQTNANLIVSIGLTLILRSVYTVEYKFNHEGISIPPKAIPIEMNEDKICEKFVKGDLILKKAKPLEFNEDGRPIGTGLVDGGNVGCCN